MTNKAYVANQNSNNVTVITPQPSNNIPLTVSTAPLVRDLAMVANPTFNFTASSAYAPTAPPVQQIYYQVDTWTGPWLRATPAGANASGATPILTKGTHIVYAYATDGQEATSINTERGSSPIPGGISAYHFLVNDVTTGLSSSPNPSVGGQTVIFTASVTSTSVTTTGTVTFSVDGTDVASVALSGLRPNQGAQNKVADQASRSAVQEKVGVPRLELGTSWSQTMRANQLRYTPS